MFAGEGDAGADQPSPSSYLSQGQPAASGSRPRSTRSPSTARTRTPRPDIYGKVGNSGVSIATLDDA